MFTHFVVYLMVGPALKVDWVVYIDNLLTSFSPLRILMSENLDENSKALSRWVKIENTAHSVAHDIVSSYKHVSVATHTLFDLLSLSMLHAPRYSESNPSTLINRSPQLW